MPVQHDHFSNGLNNVRVTRLGQALDISKPSLAIFAGNAHLDKFMVEKCARGFRDHGIRHTGITDKNDRVEMMGNLAQAFAVSGAGLGEIHGGILGCWRRDHHRRLLRRLLSRRPASLGMWK